MDIISCWEVLSCTGSVYNVYNKDNCCIYGCVIKERIPVSGVWAAKLTSRVTTGADTVRLAGAGSGSRFMNSLGSFLQFSLWQAQGHTVPCLAKHKSEFLWEETPWREKALAAGSFPFELFDQKVLYDIYECK